MLKKCLEVRSDCGAGKFMALIGLSSVFSFLLVPIAIMMVVSPQANQEVQDQFFFVVLAALCLSSLVISIFKYRSKRQQQRLQSPAFMIDKQGVRYGADLSKTIPWSSIALITESIRKESNYTEKAEFTLSLKDGMSKTFDLRSLDSKPEQIIAFTRESLRRSRGLKLKDLKNRSVSCPLCAKPTKKLKTIQSGIIVFLLFYNKYELKQHICCRECVRSIILRDSAINLLTCHITWPVLWLAAVVLPQSGKLLFSGHDAKALEHIT